jgi:putative flippase GtrA
VVPPPSGHRTVPLQMGSDGAVAPRLTSDSTTGSPVVDLVVPVYNEQDDLDWSVRELVRYLRRNLAYTFRITIADNASDDSTPVVAGRLAAEFDEVVSVRLPRKGRGGALRAVWERSDATVLAYCDVDLSSGLTALPVLIAPVVSGHSDLAIGTRLGIGATVRRGLRREVISRGYNLILRGVLRARFTDAQCGFKAIRADTARALLPLVEDTGWFFDTELLVAAQRSGLRIHEVPVDWTEDPDSSVALWDTALADLRGVGRLLRHRARVGPVGRGGRGEVLRFLGVGVASTLGYALLFLALRGPLGALAGDWVALVLATLGNTWANRRLAFGLRGAHRRVHQYASNLAVMAAGLALTSAALVGLHGLWPSAGAGAQLAVVTAANLAVTVARFGMFRFFAVRSRAGAPGPGRRGCRA